MLLGAGNGGKPPLTYYWVPEEGLSDPTIANPTASPISDTTYTLTVSDSTGLDATDEVTVFVTVEDTADTQGRLLPAAPSCGFGVVQSFFGIGIGLFAVSARRRG